MRYPAECPVFKITGTDERLVPNGTIVEGVGVVRQAFDKYRLRVTNFEDAAVIIGTREPTLAREEACKRGRVHPRDGWLGIGLHPSKLRPLTRAAREMLAIAKDAR